MGQHPTQYALTHSGSFADRVAIETQVRRTARSIHEGYGYLWELFDSFKYEVFQLLPSNSRAKVELIQIGAMAQSIAENLGYIPSGLYFVDYVEEEVARARRKHPQGARSLHEGLGIIWEEFEEFKQEVFAQQPDRERAKAELVQIAAMAQRISEDLHL